MNKLIFALTFTATALAAQAANTLISPTGITYTTSPNQELWGDESTLINGSGLSASPTFANYTTITHAAADPGVAWVTTDPGGYPSDFFASGGLPQVFVMDLGGLFSVESIVVWGYHFGSANGNSARGLNLEFSTNGGASWSSLLSGLVVNTNNTLGGIGEASFAPVSANFIRASFNDNYFDPGNPGAGGDRLGISEIRFTGTAVPEPSSALFGLAGLAALVRRRRA